MNIEITPQEINIRISPNLTYDTILTPIDGIWNFNWFRCGLLMFPQSSVFCGKISMILQISTDASISLSFLFFFLIYWNEETENDEIQPLFFFIRWRCHKEQGDEHKHWKTSRNTKKSMKITEWYDLVSEPSSDTTWCEPRDHATHN